MLRLLIAAAAFVAALAPAAASGPAGGGIEVAYVALEDDGELAVVDLERGRVTARIRVALGPHNVAIWRSRYVLVTSPPAGQVTMVDAFANRVVRVFAGFGSPHDVEVEGDYAYVTDERRGQLVVIHLPRRQIVARVAVGEAPHDVAVADRAFVTHGPRRAELTVVDVREPRRPRVAGSLAAGGPAHDISERPDTADVYVTYWNSGTVGAVDTGRRRLLFRRAIGQLVHHVQVDPFSGRLWATDHHGAAALLLSARTGRIVRTVPGCSGPHHIAFGPGRGRVAVACHDSDSVLVYDPRTQRTRSIGAGGGPHGVAVAFVP